MHKACNFAWHGMIAGNEIDRRQAAAAEQQPARLRPCQHLMWQLLPGPTGKGQGNCSAACRGTELDNGGKTREGEYFTSKKVMNSIVNKLCCMLKTRILT